MTTYHTYKYHDSTIVTIDGDETTANAAAWAHLDHVGTNRQVGKHRYIFSDHGDRSRFLAFEKAVEEGTEKGVNNG